MLSSKMIGHKLKSVSSPQGLIHSVKVDIIPNEELFSETTVGCTASYFVKIIYDVPVGFVSPPILRLYMALFAVAEGLLLLDIG